MKKIVVETISVTRWKEKLQFQLIIPDNAIALRGISINHDLNMIAGGIAFPKITHRGIGILRLRIANEDDCFFSEMLHADFTVASHEKIGNYESVKELWNEIFKPYKPLPVQLISKGTIISGYYEDLVGFLKDSPTVYNIFLTLHYQVQP